MSASLPAIGTRAVHKDNLSSGQGPVKEVYGHVPVQQGTTEAKVSLRNAQHKANTANGHEPGSGKVDIPVTKFNDEYALL